MASDWDVFDDNPLEPVVSNVRAGAKFQPKVKLPLRKEKRPTVTIGLTSAAQDTPTTTTTSHQASSNSASVTQPFDVISSTTAQTDTLTKLIQNQELVNTTEVFHSGISLPDSDNNSAPVDMSSQLLTGKEYVEHKDALHSEIPNPDTHGDLQPDSARSGKENADIYVGLDDIVPESSNANESTVNEQPNNEVSASRAVAAGESSISHTEIPTSNVKDAEGDPDRSHFSLVNCSNLRPCSFAPTEASPGLISEEAADGRELGAFEYEQEFLFEDERLGGEDQAFPGLESLNVISQPSITGTAQSVLSESEYVGDELHSASVHHDFVDFSTANVSDHVRPDHPYEFSIGEALTHHADASGANSDSPQEVTESHAVPITSGKEGTRSRKRKISTASEHSEREYHPGDAGKLWNERPPEEAEEGNKSGKPLRRRRKRSIIDETEGDNEENVDLRADNSNSSLGDEDVHNDGDDEHGKNTSHHKNAARKIKPATQNEKAGRRRKKSSEGPDAVSKEPPKKKFRHSTRRNKGQVSKELLETSDIDPRTLRTMPIRDLILLGELKEKKEAAAPKNSKPDKSGNNSLPEDARCDEDPSAPMGDLNPNDGEVTHQVTHSKFNYHSYMKKAAKKRWSKQDTELFYEAIRQFGTDFSMIGQLFPDLDEDTGRRQLVLKFKNEERRHPMKLHDALTNRSNDHSHFELVIEKLQQRQEEQNSDRDMESIGISGEAEGNSPARDETVEQKEVPTELEKAEGLEVGELEINENEVDEDDDYKWSPYNSDYE